MFKKIIFISYLSFFSCLSYSSTWEVTYKEDKMTDEKQVTYSNASQNVFVLCSAKSAGIYFLKMPALSKSNPKGMIRFDKDKAFEVRGASGKNSYSIASSFNKQFIDGMLNSAAMLLEIKDPNSVKYYKFDLKGFSKTVEDNPCLTNSIMYMY
jgi:hypothetical protein